MSSNMFINTAAFDPIAAFLLILVILVSIFEFPDNPWPMERPLANVIIRTNHLGVDGPCSSKNLGYDSAVCSGSFGAPEEK